MVKSLRNIRAITGRELASYFWSPTAYVVLFYFLLTSGITFWVYTATFRHDARQIDRVIQFLFGFAPFWILFLLMPPIITMRLFSEEKRTGTIEPLMTAPVTDAQVVFGKFLAAEIFFCLIWSSQLLVVVILDVLGDMDWGPVLAFSIGLAVLGALFNAVGLLASALTRNQLIAAMIALNCNLFLFFLQWCRGLFEEDPEAQRFFDFISIYHHFLNDYSRGVVDVRYLLLYASGAAILVFLTVKVVEARKCK